MLHHHRARRYISSNSGDANGSKQGGGEGGGECSSMDVSSFSAASSSVIGERASDAESGADQHHPHRHNSNRHALHDGGGDAVDDEELSRGHPGPPPPGRAFDMREEFERRSRCASVATSVLSLDNEGGGVGEDGEGAGGGDKAVCVTAAEDEAAKLDEDPKAEDGRAAAAFPPPSLALSAGPAACKPASTVPSPRHRSLTIRLSSEEERLFSVLVSAAEAYESGELEIEESNGSGGRSAAVDGERRLTPKAEPEVEAVTPGGKCSPVPEEAEAGEKVKRRRAPIAIRVAGGWVRDKILEMHSHDVDVALDCMTGVRFATVVRDHLRNLEREGKIPQPEKHHKIGVISANPSQSKHLETATMNIFNIEVDFVNLRAEEVYESDSRIPTHQTKQFGTPLEDALRRDFTINSLFYNVRTRQIEDWTERGIDDLLERRVIVTPLNPHTTFHDDPLRVLRAIRFAVRYNMDLADDIRSAATSPDVHSSLHRKVSRERVGKELEGMLSGKNARPDRALDLINGLRLAGSVFTFPPGADVSGNVQGKLLGADYDGTPQEMARMRERGWEEATEMIRLLPQAMESHNDELHQEAEIAKAEEGVTCPSQQSPCEGLPDGLPKPSAMTHRKRLQSYSMSASVNVRMLHLSAFLFPFHNLTFKDKKGKDVGVVSNMIKDGIKFKNRDVSSMETVMAHVDKMRELMMNFGKEGGGVAPIVSSSDREFLAEQARPRLCRLETGLLLREVKDLWVTCLLLATVSEMRAAELKQDKANDSKLGGKSEKEGAFVSPPVKCKGTMVEQVLHTSREFYHCVRGQGLDGVWKVRPLLDGRAIIAALELPRGPLVSTYIEEQIKWMLLNPDGTRDECKRHLKMVKRKKEMEELHHQDELEDEQNEAHVGVSDGGQSSPIMSGSGEPRHFSKRMHVESMELL